MLFLWQYVDVLIYLDSTENSTMKIENLKDSFFFAAKLIEILYNWMF